MQFHTGFISRLGFAIFAPTHLSGCNAFNAPFVIKEHFAGRKTGIDLYAQGLSLFPEPAYDLAEADDVIAIVVHGARCESIRNLDGFLRSREKVDLIASHRGIERCPAFCPVWEEFIQRSGFNYGAG